MSKACRGLLFFNPPYRWLGKEPMAPDEMRFIPTVPLGPASVFEYFKVHSGLPCNFYYKPDHSIHVIKNLIRLRRPPLIAISCNSYNRFACLMIARIAKEVDPSIHVVLGGVHPTFLDKQILLNYPFVDFVIRNEGEAAFLALVEALRTNGNVSNIAGLSFRDGERFVRNRFESRRVNLDGAPLIDYEYFEAQGIKNDTSRGYGARSYPVETSRGCPYSCNFCATVGMFGRRLTYRSVNKVMEQITRVPQRKERMILFHDMNFTLNKEYVRELCQALIKKDINIPWGCSMRIDLVDADLFQLMKKAGCVTTFFGIESLSETILKEISKGYTPEDAIEGVRIVAATGILPRLSFIIGFPGETDETLKESMINCMKLPPGIQAHVAPLMILPGTEIYAKALREGFDETYWLKEHKDAIPYYEGTLPMYVLDKWTRVFNSRSFSDFNVDAKEGKDGMDDLIQAFNKSRK